MSKGQIKHHLPQPACDCPLTGWQSSEENSTPPRLPASGSLKNHDQALIGKGNSSLKRGLQLTRLHPFTHVCP